MQRKNVDLPAPEGPINRDEFATTKGKRHIV